MPNTNENVQGAKNALLLLSASSLKDELASVLSSCGIERVTVKEAEAGADLLAGVTPSEFGIQDVVVADLAGREHPADIIRDLARRCSPEARIIAFGTENDVTLCRALFRAGASDYLVHPVSGPQFLASVSDLLGISRRSSQSLIVAFYAAQGGSGTGLLAAGTASVLAKSQAAGVLCGDADFATPSAGNHLGFDQTGELSKLVQAGSRLDPALVSQASREITKNLALLNGLDPFRTEAEGEEETAKRLLDLLSREHRFQVWRVNGTGPLQKAVLQNADYIYVVTTGTLPCAMAAKRLAEFLKDSGSHAVVSQVFNAVAPQQPLKAEMIAQVTGKANKLEIPYKRALGEQLATNKPLAEPGHAMGEAFQALAGDLLGQKVTVKKGFLGRFGL